MRAAPPHFFPHTSSPCFCSGSGELSVFESSALSATKSVGGAPSSSVFVLTLSNGTRRMLRLQQTNNDLVTGGGTRCVGEGRRCVGGGRRCGEVGMLWGWRGCVCCGVGGGVYGERRRLCMLHILTSSPPSTSSFPPLFPLPHPSTPSLPPSSGMMINVTGSVQTDGSDSPVINVTSITVLRDPRKKV